MDISLTILQYKEILKAIKKHLGIDVSEYVVSSLRYNMVNIMNKMHINKHTEFIKAIATDTIIKEQILSCLICESVSLFREPSLWKILKTTILDKILEKGQINIWLPELNKATDLLSLLILLNHYNIRDKAIITVSDISSINIENSINGELTREILTNSIINLEHFDPNIDLKDYTYQENNTTYINKEILEGVYYLKGDFFDVKPSYASNLVIFRNKLIYYNHHREQKAINYIHKNMVGGGFLITGSKENIETFDIDKKFTIYNSEEQIYKRDYE